MRFVIGIFLHQFAGHAVGPAEAVLKRVLAATGMFDARPEYVFFHQLAFALEQVRNDAQPALLDL